MNTNLFNLAAIHNPANPENNVSLNKTVQDFLYWHGEEDNDILNMLEMCWQSYLRTRFLDLEFASEHYDAYLNLCQLVIRLRNLKVDPRICESEVVKERLKSKQQKTGNGKTIVDEVEEITDSLASIVARERIEDLTNVYNRLNHHKISVIYLFDELRKTLENSKTGA
ncbi:MAG: hypothetical protein RJQ09_05485 [Cyclobacteriaceae bacterium]